MVARYNGSQFGGSADDRATDVAVDAAGNVYVTGSNDDYVTIKYDASGTQKWVAQFDGGQGHPFHPQTRDRAWAVAVDGSGNVYVTGDSGEGSPNLSDYLTVKYNPSGVQQWVARYTESTSYDYAKTLAVDAAREFAAERLAESGEADALGRRHIEYFLALVEAAEPHLRTPAVGPTEWVERLDREHDNIRTALDRLEGFGETQLALRLAGAVWWFWDTRNHVAEGRRRLEALLSADQRGTTQRAKALIGASAIAMSAGDVAAARGWAEQALRLNRELGDQWGIAWTTCLLGWAIQDDGDFEAARPLLAESVRLLRGLEADSFSLWTTHLLAWNHFGVGERERARELWEENLAHARMTGDRHIEALSLGALADNFVRDEGRVEDALSMLTDAYRIHRELGMPAQQAAFDLHRFASGVAAAGKPVAAARVLASAETLLEENDARVRPVIAEGIDQTIRVIRAQLDESAFGEAWAEGRVLTPDEAVDLALGTAY
jgi:tetratricopeptide (TPR) repeat protein